MHQCLGGLYLLNLSGEVMKLDHVVRQTEDQVYFKSILGRLCLGWIMDQNEARLRVLPLHDDNYTQHEMNYLSEGALYLQQISKKCIQ
jgi:hypothetical protein